jgi:Family of unknown function (DUF6074)
MNCIIIPFPLARRQSLIQRQARYAAELGSDAAARHIQHQLKVQAEAMRRKGVPETLVQHELGSMELAIRSLLSSVVADFSR